VTNFTKSRPVAVIAHRGASAAHPENTLEAFRGAVQMGADAVELDVRRTADGRAAVHHDETLADGRRIVELAASVLPDDVPLLHEALAASQPLEVIVEIKNVRIDGDFDPDQSMARVVVDTVREMGLVERVLVSSFGFATIERVRELEPALRTAFLISGDRDPVPLLDRTVAGGHPGVHPRWTMVDEAFMAHARERGLFVNTWTVDDPDEMRRLAALGVDGIITNVPDVARTVLGSWSGASTR
jgi:glycerophosphoryl diester phosphodiesterase